MSLNVKISRVDNLACIFLYVVVIGHKSFKDYDKKSRELSNKHVEQSFTLNFTFLPKIVLHHIFDIHMIINFVENATLLEL